MKTAFRYSIIRFQPFADLGEFANIGVLAIAPESGRLEFKLARKRFGRLHDFFGDEAYRAYGSAVDHLRDQLGRYTGPRNMFAPDSANRLFDYLTRPHESSIVFSDPRAVYVDRDLMSLVDVLFARLVMRQRQEAPELNLIGDIRQALRRHGISSFRAIRVEDDVVPVTFPLAHENGEFRAIHPLVFTQKTPLAVFDHGTMWKKRLGYLLARGKINAGAVLLAIEPPQDVEGSALFSAYEEAIDDLAQLPFESVKGEFAGVVNDRIIQFAAESLPAHRGLFN